MANCSTVWSNTSEANLDKIQSIQNFAYRIVTGKYDHVTPILKELKWLPVREYLYYRHTVMVYKCMTGNAPGYIAEKFQKRSDVSSQIIYSTRCLTSRNFCHKFLICIRELTRVSAILLVSVIHAIQRKRCMCKTILYTFINEFHIK